MDELAGIRKYHLCALDQTVIVCVYIKSLGKEAKIWGSFNILWIIDPRMKIN